MTMSSRRTFGLLVTFSSLFCSWKSSLTAAKMRLLFILLRQLEGFRSKRSPTLKFDGSQHQADSPMVSKGEEVDSEERKMKPDCGTEERVDNGERER